MVRCRERNHVPIATGAPQQTAALFDHLIGAGKQHGRHIETQRLGGLKVDDQLDLCGPLDRQVTWSRSKPTTD